MSEKSLADWDFEILTPLMLRVICSTGPVTDYAWNAFGELCNVATSATACGTTPTSGTSYSYNGNGVRMSAVTSSSTTDFTWDNVSAGGTPLDLNDATTTSSGTTNTSYLYGDLLFGGTAPVEQITTTTSGATVSYIVSNQTGVQGVYNGSGSSLGAVQEMAVYSVYGNQNFTSGTKVTPFAFQGSYADPTGLLYLINRYYDPTTDQFLSIDPDVATTDQPYVFANDDPLNAEDPLGLEENPYQEGGPGADEEAGTGAIGGQGNYNFDDVSSADSIQENYLKLAKGINYRVVSNPSELQEFFEENTVGGTPIVSESLSDRGITAYEQPDGTRVQLRTFSSEKSETVDIRYPDGKTVKVHILK